jgi:hypothetical protein
VDQWVILFVQLFLAATFVVAGVSKILSGGVFRGALAASGMPPRTVDLLRTAVPVVELALAAALLFGSSGSIWAALVGSTVLLTTFSAWVVSVYSRRSGVSCGCFGDPRQVISGRTLARNVVFVAVSAGGSALAAYGEPWSLPPEPGVLLACLGVAALLALGVAYRMGRPALVLSDPAHHRPGG